MTCFMQKVWGLRKGLQGKQLLEHKVCGAVTFSIDVYMYVTFLVAQSIKSDC